MEHHEAIRSQAAERYVSHQLSPVEQEAFEEHFFDCSTCAEDVRFHLTFAASVRATSREERAEQPELEPPKASRWSRWRDSLRRRPALAFSLAANLAMAAVLVSVLSTGARQAARLMAVYFAPGPTHGGEDVHTLSPGEAAYRVRFSAASGVSRRYSYEVLDAAGTREASDSLEAPADEEDLYLQIPIASLSAGVHTLVVRSGPGSEIVSWSKFRTSR
jgi:anti-sigma factor RsiW